jgi:hypothetical protein
MRQAERQLAEQTEASYRRISKTSAPAGQRETRAQT